MTTSAFLRLMAALYLVLVGPQASAQSSAVDCDTVKKATIPVELSYHTEHGLRFFLQLYRNQSGGDVVWIGGKELDRMSSPN